MLENKMRKKMAAGEPVFGMFVWSCSPDVVDALGFTDLDFMIMDGEHSYIDTEVMPAMLSAAKLHDITPVVRVKDYSRAAILKMLDLGAEGIIVPDIHTLEEVEQIVRHAKYPDIGQRGMMIGRRAGYGCEEWTRDVEEYFRESNRETLVFPMCETVDILEHVEEMAAMDGVDGVFVGPFDLSISLGIPGQFQHPMFKEALQRVVDACRKANKFSAVYVGSTELAKERIAMGYQAVAVRTDIDVLIRGYREILKEVKS